MIFAMIGLFLPRKIFRIFTWLWAYLTNLALRIIFPITFEVRGMENIPKDESYIVAMKHQSSWETISFWSLIDKSAVYVFKAELDKIPLWKILSRKSGCIAVNRGGYSKSLKQLLSDLKRPIDEKQPIVIFPEGTRVKVGKEGKYQRGLLAIAKNYPNLKILPVALNSGCYWSAKSFPNKTGKIIVDIGNALTYKYDDNLIESLKHDIEARTRLLESEALKKQ